jgi:tRNA(His) guanylyltransferase
LRAALSLLSSSHPHLITSIITSFVFHKTTILFDRRSSKLLSTILSTFTSFYTYLWPTHFPATPLQLPHLPTFDARIICYPSLGNLRDYLSWRQVDCHINNLYNTTCWAMRLRGGLGAKEVEELLKGTVASDKNEILWGRYEVNYNEEEAVFRKGSVVFREVSGKSASQPLERFPP